MRKAGSILIGMAVAAALMPGAGMGKPVYTVAKQVSLELRIEKPTFVCLDSIRLLDRGKLVYLGRPIENRSAMTVMEMATLETREIMIPDILGTQVTPKGVMGIDIPAFYDNANGTAGLIMRAGGVVTGDAEYAEWDLAANRITRRLPLALAAGAKWVSVTPIGYDPDRREAFMEVVHYGLRLKTEPNRGGHYDTTILGITDRVRTVAAWTTRNKYTGKSPYFDLAHRRSMHVEYLEHQGTVTTAHLVNLDSGERKEFSLPPVVYGFAFDPDGRAGYAYSHGSGEVITLDLVAGTTGKKRKFGGYGHLLEFVAPGLLCLGRNKGMHFIDARTLAQKDFLDPGEINKGSAHLEGSIFMPGRALVRIFYNLYVVDFPRLASPPKAPKVNTR